jgi:hypothetical protein
MAWHGMCYIFFTSSSAYVVPSAPGGLRGGFPWETCHIFSSFFMLPQFSCPLLGGFLTHGFCRWFSISG